MAGVVGGCSYTHTRAACLTDTAEEKQTIVDVVRNYKWAPMDLTYNSTSCNLDHDNITIVRATGQPHLALCTNHHAVGFLPSLLAYDMAVHAGYPI